MPQPIMSVGQVEQGRRIHLGSFAKAPHQGQHCPDGRRVHSKRPSRQPSSTCRRLQSTTARSKLLLLHLPTTTIDQSAANQRPIRTVPIPILTLDQVKRWRHLRQHAPTIPPRQRPRMTLLAHEIDESPSTPPFSEAMPYPRVCTLRNFSRKFGDNVYDVSRAL